MPTPTAELLFTEEKNPLIERSAVYKLCSIAYVVHGIIFKVLI